MGLKAKQIIPRVDILILNKNHISTKVKYEKSKGPQEVLGAVEPEG